MRKWIWLSYDLGVTGDYEALYQWLDGHGARECGDSVAAINYEYSGADVFDVVAKELRRHLGKTPAGSRIYMGASEGGKAPGRFLVGRRRPAPWAGYRVTHTGPEEDA